MFFLFMYLLIYGCWSQINIIIITVVVLCYYQLDEYIWQSSVIVTDVTRPAVLATVTVHTESLTCT